MSLREQFTADLDAVFINTDEHGTLREFRIADGHGGFIVKLVKVVWDEEEAKTQPITSKFGIAWGDVICYMKMADLPRIPMAGELIYSPANQPWEVLECVQSEGLYKLALMNQRSQAGYHSE